jgi:hypothetical protein
VTIQNYIYVGIRWMIIGITANTWFLVKGLPLESHLMEWLNIIIRVMHITFGIAWIGASFYLFSSKMRSTEPKTYATNSPETFGGTRRRILLPREIQNRPKDDSQTLALVQIRSLFYLAFRILPVVCGLLFQRVCVPDR